MHPPKTPSGARGNGSSSRSRRSSSSSSAPRDGPHADRLPAHRRHGGQGRARGYHASRSARAATRAPAPLEALPPALFRHVVGFCEDLDRPSNTHRDPEDVEAEYGDVALQEFALLSKAVHTHVNEIAGQRMRTTMLVRIQTGSRPEILALRRHVVYRRAHLREMTVHVRSWVEVKDEDAECLLEKVVLQIAEMVSQAPHLQKLDLSRCTGDLVPIVRVAAASCRQLQALLLPARRPIRSPDAEPLRLALYTGMQQWHRYGSGLRRLRIPSHLTGTTQLASSVDFLLRVCTYCPAIEALEGAFHPGSAIGGDQCIVDFTVWERFCETCTQLRGLDWLSLPWATGFFEIFAKYPKPQLTELTLRTSMLWDWKAYFDQVGRSETAAAKTSGYGATTKRVHLVLEACPGLKKLNVTINSRVTDDDTTRSSVALINPYSRARLPPPFKRENALNIGLISDKFCQAVARRCPQLDTFSVTEDNQELATEQQASHAIERFQDPALQALARLQHLTQVHLPAVNVTGDGLFALVNANVREAHGTRCYTLTMGDYSGDHDQSFYLAMLQFLMRLRHHKGELALLSKRIFLRVNNGHDDDVDRQWSTGYLRQLKGAIRALRRAHPTLTFRVDVDGLKSKTFEAMYAFGVYSAGAEHPEDSRWMDLPEDALVEDVFVKEEVVEDYINDQRDGYYDDYGHEDEEEDYDSADDEDEDGDGYYGDYQNERGHYGMGGHHFFNGLQLPDSGPLGM